MSERIDGLVKGFIGEQKQEIARLEDRILALESALGRCRDYLDHAGGCAINISGVWCSCKVRDLADEIESLIGAKKP